MPLPPSVGCEDCCTITCEMPTISWESRSASKTKCGHVEFPGFVSTPPKIYLNSTLSGFTKRCRQNSGEDPCIPPPGEESVFLVDINTVSGQCEYDSTTCSPTNTKRVETRFSTDNESCDDTPPVSDDQVISCGTPFAGDFVVPTYLSSTHAESNIDPVIAADSCVVDGPQVCDLSDEHTDLLLETNTQTALPDGYPNTTPGSYYNLTADHITLSIREGRYQFSFPGPVTRNRPNPCYKINWVERFTPDVGAVIDTSKTWSWDGVLPPGYSPGDSSTWPKSPKFIAPIPSSNGTTSVVITAVLCDCS